MFGLFRVLYHANTVLSNPYLYIRDVPLHASGVYELFWSTVMKRRGAHVGTYTSTTTRSSRKKRAWCRSSSRSRRTRWRTLCILPTCQGPRSTLARRHQVWPLSHQPALVLRAPHATHCVCGATVRRTWHPQKDRLREAEADERPRGGPLGGSAIYEEIGWGLAGSDLYTE